MKSTVQKCKNQHKQYNEKCKRETAQSRRSFLLPNSNKLLYLLPKTKSHKITLLMH